MNTPTPKTVDSWYLAYHFLLGESNGPDLPFVMRETIGLAPPPTPQGYTAAHNIAAQSQWLRVSATVPLAFFSRERADILLCEAPQTPALLKQGLIRHIWLHLHIATLIVATTLVAPETLRTSRLRPCIIGVRPLPPPCFPAAMAAINANADAQSHLDNLPF